jgi:hypothetical protein
MKRCPSCDFTFADTHRVCDFDGAELVDEPQRPPSPAKTPSRFWQVLKSPMFAAGAGLVFVLASALLVGYYDAANQLNSTAGNKSEPGSAAAPVTRAQDSTQSEDQARAEIKTPAASTRTPVAGKSKRANQSSFTTRRHTNIARVSTVTSREVARSNTARDRSSKSPAAEPREAREEAAHRKDPKLVAVLKTTWNVLKKPFKF